MRNFKKLGLLIAVIALSFNVANAEKGDKEVKAAEKGIQFTEGNWASILKKAKAENKIIFFDAYTTWCGPCKLLQKNVFTREDVAKVFNANFINVKFDMESGEGPKLAGKYPIQGYPTLFFINPNGKVVKKVLGYTTAEDLIKTGNSVKKPAGKKRTV